MRAFQQGYRLEKTTPCSGQRFASVKNSCGASHHIGGWASMAPTSPQCEHRLLCQLTQVVQTAKSSRHAVCVCICARTRLQYRSVGHAWASCSGRGLIVNESEPQRVPPFARAFKPPQYRHPNTWSQRVKLIGTAGPRQGPPARGDTALHAARHFARSASPPLPSAVRCRSSSVTMTMQTHCCRAHTISIAWSSDSACQEKTGSSGPCAC